MRSLNLNSDLYYKNAEDLLEGLTKEEAEAWYKHACTQHLLQSLMGDLTGLVNGMVSGMYSSEDSVETTAQRTAKARGMAQAVDEVIDKIRSLKSLEKDEEF